MTLSAEFQGTNRVRNQLRAVAAYHPNKTDAIIGKHAKAEQRELRKTPYPPRLAHFTHERKRFFGGIAGSFSANRVKAGQWRVTNSRPHARFVIGTMAQKRQHPSFFRWWIMRDETQKRAPSLTRQLTAELERDLENQ